MEIQLPKGITQKDVEAFLKVYKAPSTRPKRIKGEYPDYCGQCFHWSLPKVDKKGSPMPGWAGSGYCVVSCDCPTEVGNQRNPTRFLSIKEVGRHSGN